jgi:hypothetical protein
MRSICSGREPVEAREPVDAMLIGFLAMAGKQGLVVSLELDRVET